MAGIDGETVWIVYNGNWNASSVGVLGVFSTEEDAVDALDEERSRSDYEYIEEMTVGECEYIYV